MGLKKASANIFKGMCNEIIDLKDETTSLWLGEYFINLDGEIYLDKEINIDKLSFKQEI